MRIDPSRLITSSVIVLVAAAITSPVGRGQLSGDALFQGEPRERHQLSRSSVPPGPSAAGAVCEAVGSARCWYVAANAANGGDGSFARPFRRPQDAADQAGPGDFIYLRGGAEFTPANARQRVGGLMSVNYRCCAHGQPGAIITVKSYPGEQAVARGEFSNGIPTENRMGIAILRSYWRVEGLRLINGGIGVGRNGTGADVENVWVVGNHLSDHHCKPGNCGVLSVGGQPTQGGPVDHSLDPENIFFHDNIVRTVWGMQPNGRVPVPWHEDQDMEHHACFALFKSGGLVELIGNDFSECASIFYSKWRGPGPTVARGNYFHHARTIAYHWRSSQPVFENNVFAHFTRDVASFDISQGDVQQARFVANTFDFAPWSGNSKGSTGPVAGWGTTPGHVFRDNVFMGRQYWSGVPSSAIDIDGNCLIWTEDFKGADRVTFGRYKVAGHDRNGVRVYERDPDAVFASRDSGDYTLIGEAAASCTRSSQLAEPTEG